jgi:hypothetical protein
VLGVELGRGRDEVRDHRAPVDGGRVRAGAVEGQVVVEGRTACLHDDRDELRLDARGCGAADGLEPVGRSVKLAAVLGRARPAVRARGEGDRARLGRRVVEGDPARDHLRRDDVIEVAPVLVHAERLRPGRLPDAVVLEEPHAFPPHQLGGEAARSFREHLVRDGEVRLPAVADLARAVLGVAARDPVHLVGPDPRLVVAREETVEPLPEPLDGSGVDEPLGHDHEPVTAERGELCFAPTIEHRREACQHAGDGVRQSTPGTRSGRRGT